MADRSRRIAPDFSYRFSIDQIRATYAGLEEAFAAGDYSLVAEFGRPGDEITGMGMVMAGLYEQGLEALAAIERPTPLGLLCRAFGYWVLDRAPEALADLKRIGPEAPAHRAIAERLARLIETPEIGVFTISVALPIFTEETANARKPEVRYGQFRVKHVASQLAENAYQDAYDTTKPFDAFLDRLPERERPHFIFSMSPQAILPLNYDKVRIPKVMWCHDTDLFLYRGFDNFRLNDLNVVSTSQEHFELSRSLGTPCASNMMSDTLCMPAKNGRLIRDKDIDILFTGSAVTSFHSEKSRFLYRLSKLSDEFAVRIVDGHLPEGEYLKLMERARFVPIVNRYAGAVSPRWHEALSLSAYLLYPDGTPFDVACPGTFPFRAETIEADIRAHLTAYRDSSRATGSPFNIDTTFPETDRKLAPLRAPREKQAERQLRFCTFALLLRDLGLREALGAQPRRRLAWYVPPIDGMLWGTDAVKTRMFAIANSVAPDELGDERDVNNQALVYTQILHGLGVTSEQREMCLARRNEILDRGLARFPNSLLLRFNRAHWDFMLDVVEHRPPSDAMIEAFRAIVAGFERLDFEPVGSDVGIAYTLLHVDQVFPYYDYGQLMVRHLVRARTPALSPDPSPSDPRDAVLAAAHGFMGWGLLLKGAQPGTPPFDEALAYFAKSLTLFPDNLPLLRLNFQTLAQAWQVRGDEVFTQRLIDAFFAYANKFPTALLTDIAEVLPAIEQAGEIETLRSLLAEWYGFARCVEFVRKDDAATQRQRLRIIVRYRDHFPPALNQRLAACRTASAAETSKLSSFERELLAAVTPGLFDPPKGPTSSRDDDRTVRIEAAPRPAHAALQAAVVSRTMHVARRLRRMFPILSRWIGRYRARLQNQPFSDQPISLRAIVGEAMGTARRHLRLSLAIRRNEATNRRDGRANADFSLAHMGFALRDLCAAKFQIGRRLVIRLLKRMVVVAFERMGIILIKMPVLEAERARAREMEEAGRILEQSSARLQDQLSAATSELSQSQFAARELERQVVQSEERLAKAKAAHRDMISEIERHHTAELATLRDQLQRHSAEAQRQTVASYQAVVAAREEEIRAATRTRLARSHKFFNLYSSGRTATHWLAHVLSAHPDVFCVHGPELHPYATRTETEAQRTARHQRQAERVVAMNLDDYYDKLERRKFKAYGVVHGINGVGPFYEPWRYRRYYFVAQITRDPVVRVGSFVARWLHEHDTIPHRDKTLEAAVAQHHKACLDLGAVVPPLAELSLADRMFVSAAYWMTSNELFRTPIPIYRIEDLTADRAKFAAFFEEVTQGAVDITPEYLDHALAQAPIDMLQRPNRDSKTIVAGWDVWQRMLFAVLLRHFNLRERYVALGYDLSSLD